MAKINRIEKSRKEVTCSKCGKVLPIGSPYLKATPYHRRPIIRCVDCGLSSWETSTSDFVLTCGDLQENFAKEYDLTDESCIDDIRSVLEEQRDNAQDSLDNIPESLQYGPTGEMLQERIDMLESVISELDAIDFEEIRDEVRNDFDDEDDYDDEDADDEDDEEDDDYDDDDEGDYTDALSAAVEERISDALSGLEY